MATNGRTIPARLRTGPHLMASWLTMSHLVVAEIGGELALDFVGGGRI